MSGSLSKLDANQVLRAVYDDASSRLKVDAEITAQIGNVDVALDASSGDNIYISDETGANTLAVNPSGSINVNVEDININHSNDSIRVGDGTNLATTTFTSGKTGLDVNLINANLNTNSKQVPTGPTALVYGTLSSVNPGDNQIVVSHTIPSGIQIFYLQKIYLSGNQNSTYTIYLNGNTLIRTRMAHTQFSDTKDLNTSTAFGLKLIAGDNVVVKAENNGTTVGTFDVTLQLTELE